MRLIHCADIHLDSKLHTTLGAEKGKTVREDLLLTFGRMVEYAKNNNIQSILIAGDLFDSPSVTKIARNTVIHIVESNPEVDFYYLRGNHDEDAFLSCLQTVPDNLFTFESDWTVYSLGESDSIRLYGAEFTKATKDDLQTGFAPDPSFINIVMLHGQESRAKEADETAVININLFKNKGVDYLALGHIHAYKCERLDDRGKYCYCGCLDTRGFDEPGEHGFVVLDIDEENKTIRDTFVPFQTRLLHEITVNVTGANSSADIIERAKEEMELYPIGENDFVKLTLWGEISIEADTDLHFVKRALSQEVFILSIEDDISAMVDYERYMNDSSYKGTFIRLIMSNTELTPEMKGNIIHMGIEAIKRGNRP